MKGLGACGLGLGVLLWLSSGPALAGLAENQHDAHQPAPRSTTSAAEAPRPPDRVAGVEPIRCWRQASAGAIAIGETFTVVLTCAVYDAENAQVVPDESRLGVASIQMAPFEIVGGSHPPDVRRGSRRFLQYDYQLRLISPDAIGRDVNIPALSISYRIHSRVGAAASLEGRDLSHLLPMMPIKVLSLVPADASDIRDASEASLGAVDALRFRSNLFDALTLVFGALAAVMVVLALVPLARSATVAGATERARVPDQAVMHRAAEELSGVHGRASSEGWSDDLVARAQLLTRLVAAAAIDRPVSQKPMLGSVVPEGRVLVQRGLFNPVKMTVASAVTGDDLARAVSVEADRYSMTRRQQIEGLQAGLSAMATTLYRREPLRDGASLDEAVRLAISVAKEITRERNWWSRLRQGFSAQGHLRQGASRR